MESSNSRRLQTFLRRIVPLWLERRILPFEFELRRQAARFCAAALGRVLDLAGGSATYAASAVALDHDLARLCRRNGLRICADAHALPFRTTSLDAICCSAALHHIRDPGQALKEARRCLRPDGQLFLSVPYRFPATDQIDDYHRFSRRDILKLLESTDWTMESCSPIGGRFWALSRIMLQRLFTWSHGLRLPLFWIAAPVCGMAIPICCFYLDHLDRRKEKTLGWFLIARKKMK